MAVAIEIGAGGSQALGASVVGKAGIGAKSAMASGESFQSRWQSMLALLGGQSAEPGAANTETAALDDAVDAGTANLNAQSAAQRASTPSTGETDQDVQAAAQEPASSQVFSAKNVHSQVLHAAQLNSAVAESAEATERTNNSGSLPATSRKPGRQIGDDISSSTKTYDAGQTISSSFTVPVFVVAVQAIATVEATPAITAFVRPGRSSAGDGAIQKPATAPLASGGRTSSVQAALCCAASQGSGPTEPGGAFQTAAEATPMAGLEGDSVNAPASSPDLDASGTHLQAVVLAGQSRIAESPMQGAPESVSVANADSNAVQAAQTHATVDAPALSTMTALRSARALGNGESLAPPAEHNVATQPIAAPNAPAESHAPVGLHGGIHPTDENGPAINTMSTASSHEAFAALDAEPGKGAPAWLHAGAHHAEAGFNDPELGWVGVRADMGPGGVHAAIVPGSGNAAQTLSGHIAGLNAHLAAEHVSVESLRLATATGNESQGAMQQGTAQNHEQGERESRASGAPATGGALSNSAASAENDRGIGATGESAQPSIDLNGSGSHISVVV